LFYSSVAGAAVGSRLLFQLLGCCFSLQLSAAGAFQFASSVSLSEPLSESPSTIAAVTKDKILSIDLEASF
jgi:hypothetical protein